MLKIRLIAGLIAIVLTLVTLFVIPKLYFLYVDYMGSLNQDQKGWFNYSQIFLGALLAVFGFWRWKKRKK